MPPNTTGYCCDLCGRRLSRKSDLARHMKIHAPNRDEMIPCPYPNCIYQTRQRSNLQTHLNTHTGERPYKCPHNGCMFDTGDPGALTRHRRNNHGYIPRNTARNNRESSTGPSRTAHTGPRFIPYTTSMPPHNAASVDVYPHPDEETERFVALLNAYMENPYALQFQPGMDGSYAL